MKDEEAWKLASEGVAETRGNRVKQVIVIRKDLKMTGIIFPLSLMAKHPALDRGSRGSSP